MYNLIYKCTMHLYRAAAASKAPRGGCAERRPRVHMRSHTFVTGPCILGGHRTRRPTGGYTLRTYTITCNSRTHITSTSIYL